MKRRETHVLVAAVLALGLAACSSTRTDGTDTSSMTGTGGTSSMASGSSGSTHGTTPGGTASSQAGATAGSTAPNSTVTSIEVVQGQSGGTTTGSATVGSAAVGSSTTGTTGSSMTADRAYRITLRMDDGRTQVVTQDWTPGFNTGDRVRLVGGAIQR